MNGLSQTVEEKARKTHSFVLNTFHDQKQSAIAAALGVSDSTVSKWKETLEVTCRMLCAAGLKIVPTEHKCYSERELDALFILVKSNVNRSHSIQELLGDDPE